MNAARLVVSLSPTGRAVTLHARDRGTHPFD